MCVLLLAAVGCTWLLAASLGGPVRPPLNTDLHPILHTDRDHLLIYTFAFSDPQFLANLQYFIAEAVVNDTVADHAIIVQEGPSLKVRLLDL